LHKQTAMSTRQPLIETEFPTYTPLDEIIREEEGVGQNVEPVVVDSDKDKQDNPENKETPKSGLATPPGTPEYTPLNELEKGIEPEGDKEQDKDKTKEQDKDGVIEDNEPTVGGEVSIENTLTFFKEAQLLHFPENFEFKDLTEEKLQEVLEYDQKVRNYLAVEGIKSNIQDPRVFDLINHGIQGGKFADLESMFKITSEAISYDGIDVTKQPDAEKVLHKYYTEVAGFSEEKANRFVNASKMEDNLSEDAKEALDKLKEANKHKKEALDREAAQKKQHSEEQFKSVVTGLSQAVKEQGYKGEVLDGIKLMMSPVVDNTNKQVFKDNGLPMMWYEVVIENVATNPDHLAQFLAFMQTYNDKEGFTKGIEQKQKTEDSKKNVSIFDSFMKIAKPKGGGAPAGQNNDGIKYVPPKPNSYDI